MFTAGASSVDAPRFLPPRRRMQPAALHTQQLPTFFLTHAFVLPGAAEQHQPHSLADTELREGASRLWSTDNWRVRPPPQPARRSCSAVRVGRSPAAHHHTASSFCTFVRRFIQREPLTNEAAGPGRGRTQAGQP